jgi:hypothetical protein
VSTGSSTRIAHPAQRWVHPEADDLRLTYEPLELSDAAPRLPHFDDRLSYVDDRFPV